MRVESKKKEREMVICLYVHVDVYHDSVDIKLGS